MPRQHFDVSSLLLMEYKIHKIVFWSNYKTSSRFVERCSVMLQGLSWRFIFMFLGWPPVMVLVSNMSTKSWPLIGRIYKVRPEHYGRQFADDIFKCVFQAECFCLLIWHSQIYVWCPMPMDQRKKNRYTKARTKWQEFCKWHFQMHLHEHLFHIWFQLHWNVFFGIESTIKRYWVKGLAPNRRHVMTGANCGRVLAHTSSLSLNELTVCRREVHCATKKN